MSTVPADQLSAEDRSTLACTYAALLLHDSDIDVDATKLAKLLKVSGVKVESFWPKLFAKTLGSRNMADLLSGGGGGSSEESGPAATTAPVAKEPVKEAPKPAAKKEEPKVEEEDQDFGSMFD